VTTRPMLAGRSGTEDTSVQVKMPAVNVSRIRIGTPVWSVPVSGLVHEVVPAKVAPVPLLVMVVSGLRVPASPARGRADEDGPQYSRV
jgi:hypothetical protein